MPDHENQTVVRYHTAGRRQPMLIGKDASGRRLPGGPYTVYQILAVVIMATTLWHTTALWAPRMTSLSTLLVIGAATLGAGYLTGRVDFSGRNPLLILLSLLAATPALISTNPGRLRGRPLPASKPRQVRTLATTSRTTVPVEHPAAPTDSQPATLPAAAAPAPVLALAPIPPRVSVQQRGLVADRLTPLEAFLAAAGKAS